MTLETKERRKKTVYHHGNSSMTRQRCIRSNGKALKKPDRSHSSICIDSLYGALTATLTGVGTYLDPVNV